MFEEAAWTIDNVRILRCHEKYLSTMMSESAKILNYCLGTHMLVDEVHVHLIHAGVAYTLAQIREEYWIPQGRTEISKVLFVTMLNMSKVQCMKNLLFNFHICHLGQGKGVTLSVCGLGLSCSYQF